MNDSRSPSGGRHPDPELCGVCGGDGRLQNAWGQVARCPSCHGSGRRRDDVGFHDVTKTKPSHHQASNRAPVVEKRVWPSTAAGDLLAKEIRDAPGLSADLKARLTSETIAHESTHGQCTQTFLKKIRKQLRGHPGSPA
ncbi:MAG: molecular chaperone DnaJ [Polyangiaceae bacterium]